MRVWRWQSSRSCAWLTPTRRSSGMNAWASPSSDPRENYATWKPRVTGYPVACGLLCPSMPLARGVRVQAVHIFCSPGGLAIHPSRTEVNQRDEAVDAESQDGHDDDVHPPHADHRQSHDISC